LDPQAIKPNKDFFMATVLDGFAPRRIGATLFILLQISFAELNPIKS
jgi:hypothetical protein